MNRYFRCEECNDLWPYDEAKEAYEAETDAATFWSRRCKVRFYRNLLCPVCFGRMFFEDGEPPKRSWWKRWFR
jgi:hypothetical protein